MKVVNINLAALDRTNDHVGINRDVSYHMQYNEPWIRWGCNNDLPYFLADIIQRSPTLSPIVKLIYILTAGDGFQYDEKNIALKNFIEDTDLERAFEGAAKQRAYYNASALEVRYNDYGYIGGVNSISLPALRVQNAPIQEVFYMSPDWRHYTQPLFKPFTMPVFNPATVTGVTSQILYDIEETQNNFHYGVEFYRAALKSCQTEINLETHWLASTQNGLLPSGVWIMKEDMSPEELALFKKQFRNENQGPNNAGAVIFVNFEGEFEPKYIPINNTQNAADVYDSLNSNITQKIVSGCNLLNPSLAGLPSTGGGFNMTDQLSSALEYFYNIFIPVFQKPLLRQFAKILKYNGLIQSYDEISIKKKKALPYYFDSNILLSIYSKNELRKNAGDKPSDQPGADELGNSPVQTQQPAPKQSPTNSAPTGANPPTKLRYRY